MKIKKNRRKKDEETQISMPGKFEKK